MAVFGLEDGVDYIETCIKAGKFHWVMNTDFGKVVVEIIKSDYDVMNPVDLCDWRYAPETQVTSAYSEINADYYMAIGSGSKNQFSRHCRIVEAMIRLLFMSCLHTSVPQKMYDAAVQVYLKEFDGKTVTQNFITDLFKEVNLSFIDRHNNTLIALMETVIGTKMELADEVIKESEIVLKQYHNTYHFVSVDFGYVESISEKIFGIMLYASSKDPSIKLGFERESYHMVIDEKRTIHMDKVAKDSKIKLIKNENNENIMKPIVTKGGE